MKEVKKGKKKKGPTTFYSKTRIRRIAGYKTQSKIAYASTYYKWTIWEGNFFLSPLITASKITKS